MPKITTDRARERDIFKCMVLNIRQNATQQSLSVNQKVCHDTRLICCCRCGAASQQRDRREPNKIIIKKKRTKIILFYFLTFHIYSRVLSTRLSTLGAQDFSIVCSSRAHTHTRISFRWWCGDCLNLPIV